MAGEGHDDSVGVRVITAAPEVEGVGSSIEELTRRGIVFSIGHRLASIFLRIRPRSQYSFSQYRIYGPCDRGRPVRRAPHHPSVQRDAAAPPP